MKVLDLLQNVQRLCHADFSQFADQDEHIASLKKQLAKQTEENAMLQKQAWEGRQKGWSPANVGNPNWLSSGGAIVSTS